MGECSLVVTDIASKEKLSRRVDQAKYFSGCMSITESTERFDKMLRSVLQIIGQGCVAFTDREIGTLQHLMYDEMYRRLQP